MTDETVAGYQRAAARLVAHQHELIHDWPLCAPGGRPGDDNVRQVMEATCLLARGEVPEEEEAVEKIAKDMLCSPLLIKRLAVLEETRLPCKALSKLATYIGQDFAHCASLPPSFQLVVGCITALYNCQCATLPESSTLNQEAEWISPPRTVRVGSPRREGKTIGCPPSPPLHFDA
eukprot:Sspe_Gene.68439::Locus_40372_Transcript_1_3_Confidence_0.400_Length_745::g.68439::m.68439